MAYFLLQYLSFIPDFPIKQKLHCRMVRVWCKIEQNRTKATEVIEQKP